MRKGLASIKAGEFSLPAPKEIITQAKAPRAEPVSSYVSLERRPPMNLTDLYSTLGEQNLG